MSRERTRWLSVGAILMAIFCLHIFTPTVYAAESGQGAVCKSLTFNSDSTKYSFAVTALAGHGTRITGYKFDFGDHQSYSFTFAKTAGNNRNTAKIDHSYARSGIYQATAFVIASEHGKMHYETSKSCKASVAVGEALPSELTNVGSGNTILLFAGVALASGSAHHFALKLRRSFTRAV